MAYNGAYLLDSRVADAPCGHLRLWIVSNREAEERTSSWSQVFPCYVYFVTTGSLVLADRLLCILTLGRHVMSFAT